MFGHQDMFGIWFCSIRISPMLLLRSRKLFAAENKSLENNLYIYVTSPSGTPSRD